MTLGQEIADTIVNVMFGTVLGLIVSVFFIGGIFGNVELATAAAYTGIALSASGATFIFTLLALGFDFYWVERK